MLDLDSSDFGISGLSVPGLSVTFPVTPAPDHRTGASRVSGLNFSGTSTSSSGSSGDERKRTRGRGRKKSRRRRGRRSQSEGDRLSDGERSESARRCGIFSPCAPKDRDREMQHDPDSTANENSSRRKKRKATDV